MGTATTGRRAVEMTQTLEPELILMDYGMPDLDGISAALEIPNVRPLPIVLVTGHAEPEVVERAAGAGIVSYLLKPVTQRTLGATMQFAFGRFGER